MLNREAIVRACIDFQNDPQGLLRKIDALYTCPMSAKKLHGPLVGYPELDEDGRQYVGTGYVNMRIAAQYPLIMREFAEALQKKLTQVVQRIDVICEIPNQQQGLTTGSALAQACDCIYASPDEYIISHKQRLTFTRHSIDRGSHVVISCDAIHDIQIIKELAELIRDQGGVVVGIAAIYNRAVELKAAQTTTKPPIICLIPDITPRYSQGDPHVIQYITEKQIVWEPEEHWEMLMSVMKEGQS